MKLSTRSRYGLRALLDLAGNFGEGPLLLESIAKNQGTSRKYLHTLLTTLKSAGLVRSVRGTRGGYILGRAPSKIKLSEVVRVLEGSLSLVDCVEEATLCERADRCVTREVWQSLARAMEEVLDKLTLEDLINRMREKQAKSIMYHI